MLALVLALSALLAFVLWIKRKQGFWQKLGFPVVKPELMFGNIRGMGITEFSAVTLQRLYHALKGRGPIGGMYFFVKPTALVLEPEILKNILVKDFGNFHDRGLYVNESIDPLSGTLFGLEGERWRQLRSKVTPSFTSGRLKLMFGIMMELVQNLTNYLDELTEKGEELELKEILARFSTDVISFCAYGLETNTLKDEKSRLRDMGAFFFQTHFFRNLYLMTLNLFRNQAKRFNLRFVERHITDYFLSVIRQTVEHRERTGYQRNDFIQLLIQLKNKGQIDGDNVGHITFNEVAAMCFTIFLAGFETSSNVLTFCLYELCQQQDIQEKLRRECIKGLQKHGNKLTYECAGDIPYLDQVIKETLRKWPSITMLLRMTKNDYPVPDSSLVLPKNTWLMVPIFAYHHDPAFFPDPERFDPDRFTPENEAKIPPFHYLPFGEGPRICLGIRFGYMEIRLTLISLLMKYRFRLSSKTESPMKLMPQIMGVLVPKGGVWMHIEKLEKPYEYER